VINLKCLQFEFCDHRVGSRFLSRKQALKLRSTWERNLGYETYWRRI